MILDQDGVFNILAQEDNRYELAKDEIHQFSSRILDFDAPDEAQWLEHAKSEIRVYLPEARLDSSADEILSHEFPQAAKAILKRHHVRWMLTLEEEN